MNDYVSIDTFAKRYGLKSNTVKKNIDKVVGAYYKDGVYYIPDSCRYPYNLKNIKFKSRNDRKYVILRATSENKFVDNNTVGVSKKSFDLMIGELIRDQLLQYNGTNDKNGANSYDVTDYADRVIKEKNNKSSIINELFIGVGCAVGAAYATYENLKI